MVKAKDFFIGQEFHCLKCGHNEFDVDLKNEHVGLWIVVGIICKKCYKETIMMFKISWVYKDKKDNNEGICRKGFYVNWYLKKNVCNPNNDSECYNCMSGN